MRSSLHIVRLMNNFGVRLHEKKYFAYAGMVYTDVLSAITEWMELSEFEGAQTVAGREPRRPQHSETKRIEKLSS